MLLLQIFSTLNYMKQNFLLKLKSHVRFCIQEENKTIPLFFFFAHLFFLTLLQLQAANIGMEWDAVRDLMVPIGFLNRSVLFCYRVLIIQWTRRHVHENVNIIPFIHSHNSYNCCD